MVGDKFRNEFAVAICLALAAVSLTFLQLTDSFLLLVPVFFMIGATFTPWDLMNAAMSSLSPENLEKPEFLNDRLKTFQCPVS